MRTTCLVMLLAACLLAPVAAQGYWVIVEQGGTYATITEGLAAALPGDYVRVKPGTYSASTGETMPIEMRAGVTLMPHEGLGTAIIDGEGLTRCMNVINPNGTTKIEKMVFQNGSSIAGDGNGGGLWIGDLGVPNTPRIVDCIFRNNVANHGGGGLYADQSAKTALIDGCRFSNNTATNGGGIYAIGNGPIQMARCVFDGNSVTGYGGGLYVEFPDIARDPSRIYSIQKMTFTANSAALGGSALYTDPSLHYLSSSIIAFNTSDNDPIMCSEYAHVQLSCCDVFGNAGGDYVGIIAGQLGTDMNIWNNPEFCGVEYEPDHPYTINVNSPCADDNNGDCPNIGARLVGCGIPYLNFNREWLEYYIPFGEEFCQNLIFQNGGDLALNWELFAYEGILERGSGGPDAFGYRWGDSDKPDGPSFEWNDISGVGTQVTLGNDDATLVVLPFDFPFYDTSWFEFALSSNGYMTFGYDWTASLNGPIPDTNQPNEFIAPFWEDLDPSQGGTIHYHYSPDAGTFTVQFTEVPNASSVVGGEYTFQVVLFDDGTIRFYYLSMIGYVEGATIGIENPDGTIGLQVAHNEPYMHDDLAVIIDLGPPAPAWIWMSLTEGTLSPGEEAVCECCVETSDLEGGIYEATLVMASDDFNVPMRYIPLTAEVFPTGVDDEMSARLTLRGNYPNPFNPQTKIAFDLPEPARVSLRVYSAAGRLVRSLIEGVPMAAGPHVQSWDGRDGDGTALASGVYFCMLEANGVSLAGRMVLLK